MKRIKRFTLRRVALALAVAAVIAPAAQAEPIGSYERQSQVEIPYLSHGNLVATDFWNYDPATGERIANPSPGVSADQLAGLYSGSTETAIAADDLTLSRPSNAGSPSVTATDTGWDVGPTTVSAFALGFVLLAGASLLAIRHNRRTRLSPA